MVKKSLAEASPGERYLSKNNGDSCNGDDDNEEDEAFTFAKVNSILSRPD